MIRVFTFCFVLFFSGLNVFAVDVTFQVDMSLQTVAPEGVHIAGTFQDWDPGATPMTDAGDNIYTYTHSFNEGDNIQWKYINGDEWGEDESVPSECAQDNNRYLVVPGTDIILDVVCFGSCTACGDPVDITFRVDLSEENISPDGIHIAGNFQGWNPSGTAMTDVGDQVYEVTLTLSSGETALWKYINGNTWDGQEIVPQACGEPDGYGAYNRVLDVPEENTILDLVCFSSCEPCGYVPVEVDVTFQVDMSMETISPDGIHLAGSMQGWDPATTALTDVGEGIYEVTLTLLSNETHQYKYINGMDWPEAEVVPEECGVDDGNGAYNRYFTVPEDDITLDLVCFSSCAPCSTGIQNQENTQSFSITPNPSDGQFSITYELKKGQAVSIIIYSSNGNLVYQGNSGYKQAGVHIDYLNPGLLKGVYFVVFSSSDNHFTKKLVIQ